MAQVKHRYQYVLKFSVILLFICFFCPAGRAALKGGSARVNITPPVGVWLSGYGSRDKPSDDIVDELYAPEQNVLICATHTHFGPKIFAKTKIGPDVPDNTVDKAYVQTLIKKMTDSVFLAHKNMQDVKIGAKKGQVPEIVYNRRPRKSDGSVQMTYSLSPEVIATREIQHDPDGSVRATFTLGPNEPELTFGPIDPDAWVLRVENMDGQIIGSIVNFACHAVSGSAFSDWFYSISADFPGETVRVVEKVEGGICLFTAGTTGNIVPIQRGKKPRFQIGKALAGEALRQLQFVPTFDDIKIEAMTQEVKLPIKQDLSPDRIMDADNGKEHLVMEIQVLRLGDIHILGLPGEVLVEVGLEIKKKSGLESLIIISLSNDAIGYVCPSRAYDEGGYEPGSGTNLAKGAAEIIIQQALELLGRMKTST
ncbi:MAG: hypothetical protein ACYTFW_23620 [Planctomycetota bacterium]